jgi:hypothetical protein
MIARHVGGSRATARCADPQADGSRAEVGPIVVGHDRVDAGADGDLGQMCGREPGRADHQSAHDAVELHKRARGRELIPHGKEGAASMQGRESVEAGRACEHIEGNTTTSRPKEGLGARDGA